MFTLLQSDGTAAFPTRVRSLSTKPSRPFTNPRTLLIEPRAATQLWLASNLTILPSGDLGTGGLCHAHG